MRFAILAASVLVTGCASTPAPTPPAEPEPEAPAARVVWSVPITYADGVPVISAKVRDGETMFAIATSSSNHTLTKSFASAVRAPVSTTRQTTRVHGASADVEKVEGVVSIKAANADWRLEQVVALDTTQLDPRNIGGLLVPQALTSNTTTVVLDFKGGALTLVEGDAALFATWFTGKFGAAEKVALTRENGLVYLDVAVGSGAAQRAQLDTASPRSRFPAADIGVTVAKDACVKGADLMAACLPGAPGNVESLTIGALNFPAWEAVGVATGQAAIGADVLKGCVVAIGVGNEAHMACN